MKPKKFLGLALIYNDNNELLLQDRFNMSKFGEGWGYFGGKIEVGETKEEATKREILEELEFNIKEMQHLGHYETSGIRISGSMQTLIQEVFLVKVTMQEFKEMVLHEGAGMNWFSISEAKKKNMYPLDPQILIDFEKFTQQ